MATLLDWRPQAEAYLSVYDGLCGSAQPAPPIPTPHDEPLSEVDSEGRRSVNLDNVKEFDRYLMERSTRAEWSTH